MTMNNFSACWWVVAIVLIKSGKSYAAGALYIQWRWNLTEDLHMKYFSNKIYYDLNCLNSAIDNPDMRITQVWLVSELFIFGARFYDHIWLQIVALFYFYHMVNILVTWWPP